MLKYLLSLVSIFVLLLPSVLVPARAEACPVILPETLLSLYRNSDVIYVARFDKVEDGEVLENSEERMVLKIKNHFDISSTLKGETRKFYAFEQNQYRSKASEEETEPDEESDEESPYGTRSLKPGDLVLLFLKYADDGSGIGLTDHRDGIKKMTPQRLESYEARIRELNSIFSAKKVDDAAIVDWLVRCTQDPATRWEGAFQLQQSFQRLAWLKRQEDEPKEENAEDAETVEENEAAGESGGAEARETVDTSAQDTAEQEVESESDAGDVEETDESVYATLLSEAQKDTLMNIVLERQPAVDKDHVLSLGDKVLIDVVSNWGDQRFAKFLLDRLQRSGDEPYEVSELMSMIANALTDETLQKIAEKYSGVHYEDDDDVVEPGEIEETPGEAEGSKRDIAQIEGGSSDEQSDKTEPDAAEPAPVTYKQLRAELHSNFVNRSLVVMAVVESDNQIEKASR